MAPIAALGLIGAAMAPPIEPPRDAPTAESMQLSAAGLFALADAALAKGDFKTAEAAYRALLSDPDQKIRSEARFRLSMVFVRLKKLTQAAVLLRQILDEEPDAQRVRLELARVLDQIGDEAGARKALREAQAGGLPPDVARLVDRYSDALRAQKPLGASLEVALAPDSNINRATRSDTLKTVIGDFTLDKDARQQSGIGIAVEGQAYGRLRFGDRTNLLARMTGTGRLYGHDAFNDVLLGVSAGPEFRFHADRLTAEIGANWRWFGGRPYSTTATATLNYFHPLDRQSQLRALVAFAAIDNRRSRLQDGRSHALSLSYERALSNRAGIAITLSGDRQKLRDRGYSTVSGNLTLLGYREIGAATLVGTIGYGRLEADERLAIYPLRRIDDFYRASFAVTYRGLRIAGFSPLVRISAEHNSSSLELYRYRRIRTELGIARAF